MSGPTLTAAVLPTVKPEQSFQSPSHSHSHSHSTTEVYQAQSPPAASSNNRSSSTNRPPGQPDQPVFDVPTFDFGTDFDPTLSFPNQLLSNSTNEKPTIAPIEEIMVSPEPRTGRVEKWKPSTNGLQITPDCEEVAEKGPSEDRIPGNSRFLSPNPQETHRSVSESLASFAKRPWMSGSRSPSPNDKKKERKEEKNEETEEIFNGRLGRERSASNSSIMKLKRSSRKRPASPASSDGGKSTDSRSKFGSYLNRIKQRQPGMLSRGKSHTDNDSLTSSTASIAPPSTETRQSHNSETSNSTAPDDGLVMKSTRPRDPLWSAFKELDNDYHKLQTHAKPNHTNTASTKMEIIRKVLMRFLGNYANHSSNKKLHHEDLERRATILDKWWKGLLELLEGKNQQAVTGADRPDLLDATASIMMRPEWRQCNASFCPLSDRSSTEQFENRARATSNTSSSSVDSTDSAFLAESARHNVEVMFITNLVSQMAIVVDKLSLRHAPLSLVNFAGKVFAYAFFFAPGIADVLVRLWSLNSDLIRRVADEFGLPRDGRGDNDSIAAFFPPAVSEVRWSSVKTLSSSLKRPAKLPVMAAHISWRGPWVSRWAGRDTDLFFIFCKYYYMLAEEFMPPSLPLVQKACAPGFVLVNAQILSILDSTIHRQAAVEAMLGPPLSDTAHGADASAMALPAAPNNNIMKGMNENRLILLLKDFLSSASVLFAGARHTFAESFMAIMKAAAKRTSQFDHNACFTICDFLQEALVTYNNFVCVQTPDFTYVDWPFWIEVCKRILDSNHTMSEIRVISFIFSIWETIEDNPLRKEIVCLDWLLQEEVFNKFFTNWCPMVRAYYMRLLCWRLCRDAGNADDTDAKIFLVVYSRLKTVWSHYLWLKQVAEQQGKCLPSTAPSFPAPGKRFMIIRSEMPSVQPGLMVGFDSSAPSPQTEPQPNPATHFESMDSIDFDIEPSVPKKRSSILGKIFSFANNSSANDDLESVRRETAISRSRTLLLSKSSASVSPPASDSDSIGSSPIYEDMRSIFKFTLSWNSTGTMSPPNRILTRPRLPSPAQSCVAAKGAAGSSPPHAPDRPAPTRAVSGSPNPGLVDSARNADPSGVPSSPSSAQGISATFDRRQSFSQMSPIGRSSDDLPLHSPISQSSQSQDDASFCSRPSVAPTQEPIITPVEPKGVYAKGAKYAGRALAEWSLVVAECNSFVDRRRSEGVPGLSEVEVPALEMDGFRKIG
ncbi:DUF1765-domain-containing protein [Daldinia caldariorum]|uniref:DUF1765-domain-containing protein n=1 Tax=Daldinia caldariorum TaxID=326644 RepID=UPI002008BCD5|nr:DUF1765-domain-containing protein [Daldinia caldariorum]KAI1470896.1 DUF1765-domain-containing protein [Daldinia caldariorum]